MKSAKLVRLLRQIGSRASARPRAARQPLHILLHPYCARAGAVLALRFRAGEFNACSADSVYGSSRRRGRCAAGAVLGARGLLHPRRSAVCRAAGLQQGGLASRRACGQVESEQGSCQGAAFFLSPPGLWPTPVFLTCSFLNGGSALYYLGTSYYLIR